MPKSKINEIPFDTEELVKKINEVKKKRLNAKYFCYNCQVETKQALLFDKTEMILPNEVVLFDEKGNRRESIWTIEGRVWKIFECSGCEKTNLNVFARYSPFEDDVLVHRFPIKNNRQFPTWITYLNKDFTELLSEIYLSLNLKSIRLPLMGARTLLDMFITKKIGDIGTFKNKLQKLVDEKYISNSAKELLEVALEFGNATIHRGFKPKEKDVNDVLDIVENILHSEALTEKAKDLKKRAPKKTITLEYKK